MKAVAIIQARMGSSRLPGKSMMHIGGHPILWHMYRQLEHSKTLDAILLATTTAPADDVLAAYAESQNWRVFRGSETDVLDRYWRAASSLGLDDLDAVLRLCGDDILPDPDMVDAVVLLYRMLRGRVDYVATNRKGDLPYGAGVEMSSYRALARAAKEATSPFDREHVMPYIKKNPSLFNSLDVVASTVIDATHLAIDHAQDFERNAKIIEYLSRTSAPPYALRDVIAAAEAVAQSACGDRPA